MKDFIMKTVGGIGKMVGKIGKFLIAITAIAAGCLLFLFMIFMVLVLG